MTTDVDDKGPKAWAVQLTQLLNATGDDNRFPIKVGDLAIQYTQQRFSEDPIKKVVGDALPGFEGALEKAPIGKKGWGILYNSSIESKGRINFTLAHEFGHYLVHRNRYPDGIRCSEKDTIKWDSELGQVEYEANVFAAWLLMPFDDFRLHIPADAKPTLDDLSQCASRYGVSLTAATLRWLEYTSRRACFVVSTEGFILWSKPSKSALRTGGFIRTKNLPPVEVPPASLTANNFTLETSKMHGPGIWFPEPCEEYVLRSDNYDMTLSLIHMEDRPVRDFWENDDES